MVLILFSVYLETKNHSFLFGINNVLIGSLLGILGLFLFMVSLFTDHVITYYNENLFLINPFSLLIPVLGIAYLLKKRWSLKWLGYVWYFHLLSAVILLILKLLPNFDQDISLALAFILPIHFTFAISLFYLNRIKFSKEN